ncbi:hypothetical protein [Alkalicoccus saliphilus]|uniref:Restriction endonuclease type IV Mrr domain-containing protein n=1 Tax=Alkalicoccus saliphilus TaxID=200989 RepID=A0A2T4U5V2_9BACI|nr:hypothetical protein [Alkalicoccus saliphilus]PTL38774.1 hypothetical protein C6Y45_09790 [Alkalicoccus saliphilus]
MKIAVESLKGYLLEEAAAYLIKNTGFDLLVEEEQDPSSLRNTGTGLHVRGLGVEHQADVLGQLQWMPAFTYPVRLFLEAEFRSGKTSIKTIRSAVATISDLNQRYMTTADSNTPLKRCTYNYAVFSASGFSRSAVEMALAHQISLVDLSSGSFRALLSEIASAAEDIHRFASGSSEGEGSSSEHRYVFIQSLRKYLRHEFGTWTGEKRPEPLSLLEEEDPVQNRLKQMSDVIRKEYGEVFAAVPNAPFLLILKAENAEDFRNYASAYPTHRVKIRSVRSGNEGKLWEITPEKVENYHLSVLMPEQLHDLIMNSGSSVKPSWNSQKPLLSCLTVYRHTPEKDEIIRLEYNPDEIEGPLL